MNRHRTRRAAAAGLVVLAIGLAACSSKASSGAATTAPAVTAPPDTAAETTAAADTTLPTLPDPCSLVSQSQAEAVVGMTLLAPLTAGNADDLMCQYDADPNGPVGQVGVHVGPGAKKNLDIDKDTLQHDFTTLAGVGDEAYLEAGSVFVRKGTIWVAVNVVSLDADPTKVQQALTDLASTIAGELP